MTEREPLGNDSHPVPSPETIDERDKGVIQGAFGTIRLEDRAPRYVVLAIRPPSVEHDPIAAYIEREYRCEADGFCTRKQDGR